MKVFEFTIVASGLDPQVDDFEDRFFAAGCDDTTISFQKGVILVEFARTAKSFAHALISACIAVRKAGATIERIEPDYLVSLSDIAARSGLTRSAISLYCKGERASAFPTPKARVTSESPLWDWVEVSSWMHEQKRLPVEAVVEARLMREANIVTTTKSLPDDVFVRTLEETLASVEASA